MSEITERVERGAALLDEKRPGWWSLIDLRRLDIDSKCNCVLGQIGNVEYRLPPENPGFGIGLAVVGLERGLAAEYGMDAPGGECLDEEYDALNAAWLDLIERRRDAASVTT